MIHKSIFLIVLLSICLGAYSQTKGKVRVFIKPKEAAIIKIDSHYLVYGKFIVLDTGTYQIKAWAPKRNLVVKSIEVTPNGFNTVAIKLPYSPQYKHYKYREKIYKYKIFGLKYGALASYGALSTYSIIDILILNKSSNKLEKQTKEHQQAFESGIYLENIAFHKDAYLSSKSEYNEEIKKINRRLLFIQVGAVASVAITYFTRKAIKSVKKPGYYERPRLSNLQIQPYISTDSQGAQLTIKL